MIYKKGVSPLIATILLLAFAVSLATLIVQIEPFGSVCDNLAVEIPVVDGKQEICYNVPDKQIEITLKNLAQHNVVGVAIQLFNANGKKFPMELPIEILPNDGKVIPFPYDKTFKGNFGKNADGSIKMKFIVTYNVEDSVEGCPADLVIKDIPVCDANAS